MERGTAVVTGAGSGIGRALAETLADRGFDLVLADVDAAALAAVTDRLGAIAVVGDVAVPATWDVLGDSAPDPRLICLNAGIVGRSLGAPWEVPADEWQRVLAVNVAGVTNGLRTFVPGMLAAGDDRFVLITGSLAGVVTFATGGAYPASKHAVVALAEQAALSLSGTKVSVTLLCPALVRTGMSPEGVDPLVVAERALDAAEQRRFAVIDDDWHGAVARRAATLISGGQPHSPVPGSLS